MNDLRNLTGHLLRVPGPLAGESTVLAPDPRPAWVHYPFEPGELGELAPGLQLVAIPLTAVVLPDPVPGVTLIVPELVAALVAGRRSDVCFPFAPYYRDTRAGVPVVPTLARYRPEVVPE